MQRHRSIEPIGPFVLSLLGLLGGFLVPYFFLAAPVSLVMAWKGLRQIARGEADPAGRPLLQSALVLSWAGVVVGTLMLIAALLMRHFFTTTIIPMIEQAIGSK